MCNKVKRDADTSVDGLPDLPDAPKSFLLEEYKQACEFHKTITSQIPALTKQAYAFSAGLLAILGFMTSKIGVDVHVVRLAEIAIPVVGIIVALSTISALLNARRREFWIYDRMNFVRSVMLDSVQDRASVKIAVEGGLSQVRTDPYSSEVTEKKFKRHESVYNVRILCGFLALWVLLLAYAIVSLAAAAGWQPTAFIAQHPAKFALAGAVTATIASVVFAELFTKRAYRTWFTQQHPPGSGDS
jgi:hypothetical protein